MRGQGLAERCVNSFVKLLGLAHDSAHLCLEVLEECGIAEYLVQLVLVLFIYIFIYGQSEILYGSDDVPTQVLADVVAYVVENPFHDIAFGQQLLNHLVDSLLLHLLVVE